jgi:four helix bundle protein
MKEENFGFKKLKVWEKALEYADQVIDVTEDLNTEKKHFRLIEQIESAAASIAQNISEGKGRYSKKEFVRHLYIARGSLYEVITLLNLFHKRKWISEDQLQALEYNGLEIAKMIKGLINSLYDE